MRMRIISSSVVLTLSIVGIALAEHVVRARSGHTIHNY
jgi:hypothetical protein